MTKKAKNDSSDQGNGKPKFEYRLGNIRVSVWKNSGDNGTWFNTVITRRYRNNDSWAESSAFNGMSDLALVAEGVRLARDFIAAQELGTVTLDE